MKQESERANERVKLNGFWIVLNYNLNRRTIYESRQLSNVDLAFASESCRGNEEIELNLLDVRESVERKK